MPINFIRPFYIIRDEVNRKDKNSDYFEKALRKRFNEGGYDDAVITVSTYPESNGDDVNLGTLFKPTSENNINERSKAAFTFIDLDTDSTAFAIMHLSKGFKSNYITIIGYGDVVGKPLHDIYIKNSHILRSSSSFEEKLCQINKSDLVVVATPNTKDIENELNDIFKRCNNDKVIIDCAGFSSLQNYAKCYTGPKAIGELTVDTIYKNYIKTIDDTDE